MIKPYVSYEPLVRINFSTELSRVYDIDLKRACRELRRLIKLFEMHLGPPAELERFDRRVALLASYKEELKRRMPPRPKKPSKAAVERAQNQLTFAAKFNKIRSDNACNSAVRLLRRLNERSVALIDVLTRENLTREDVEAVVASHMCSLPDIVENVTKELSALNEAYTVALFLYQEPPKP